MALIKNIELDNGIVLSYHRINTVLIYTNRQINIEVTSYINQAQREKEIEIEERIKETGVSEDLNTFTETKYYSTEYNEEFSVNSAYEYLKTLEVFTDATDEV